MTEPRPLLAFGPPTVAPIPTGSPGFVPLPRRPTPAAQGVRLAPQFSELQQALASASVSAGEQTSEPDPELVVVFDLAGSVDEFRRAVAGIDGLEFLTEVEEEPVEPDDEFYTVNRKGVPRPAPLPETLYMVMSNARAVTELIRLFELWQADPTVTFATGLNPLKKAFSLLRTVRRWGPADRVRETGLLEAWEEDVRVAGGQGWTRVEIELWFRDDAALRLSRQAEVERLIVNARGTVISSSVIEAIDYHAVLAELPLDQVQLVLQQGRPDAIELLTTESVMLVAPVRPMTIPALEVVAAPMGPVDLDAPTIAAPRVALLDGLPLANHVVLSGRLVLDDPDNQAALYSARQQNHATAMASLISHGDLSAPGPALTSRLYVRPIMQPHPFFSDREIVAPGELLVDLIHRAFVRMFEGDAEHPPAAPSVRIVNLSIGDPVRAFSHRMSPLAKLLDWLTHRYNLLVLVSAGNQPIQASVPTTAIDDVGALQNELAAAGYMQARLRRLLSPAEAVNVITVGALHDDAATLTPSDSVLDAVAAGMPAAYGAIGFGYRRSVKPEILLPGGRQLHQRPPPQTDPSAVVTLSPARHSAVGPGILVAAPGADGGNNGSAYSHGTSNATALATRSANQIFDVLTGLDSPQSDFDFPDPQYHPVVAKALLVHAADWGELGDSLRETLQLEERTARRDLTQLLGYGPVRPERAATAARTRVVLLGAGSIAAKQRQQFSLPLPTALTASTEWRRLTITLAWLSPINARSQIHRQARLRFHPHEQDLGVTRTQADPNSVRKGTVQHEILEGTAALAFVAGDSLDIDVDCLVDAGKLDASVRYGLAVSLEMASTIQADIHAEIRQGLQAQVRERARLAARG